MEHIWVALVVLVAYLFYKLFIKPMRIKAFYAKTFKANGYKIFEYPYSILIPPFLGDWLQKQKTKKDFNYTGKHVYSDSYDLAVCNILNSPQLVFFNEKLIKAFMDKDFQMKLSKMNIGLEAVELLAPKATVFLTKDVWKHRRSLLSKVFNFDFIVSQIPNMIHSANISFQEFQRQYLASLPDKRQQKSIKVHLQSMMSKYTSSIIMLGFLGLDSIKQQLKGKTIQYYIRALIRKASQLSKDPLVLIFGKKFIKLGLRQTDRQLLTFSEEVNQILKTYVQNYRQKRLQQGSKQNTIVELILQEIQKEKSTEKDIEITDEDLIDQIKGFVAAGTDTSASYLQMLILHIYEHKHVYDRLKAQIDKYIKSDQDITYENIKKIVYLDYILQESSRVFSAVENGFQRKLQEDSSICDIPIAKGTCVNIYTRPMLTNPKIFKDPLQFKPERWEESTQENKRLVQLISYQFYGGPRSCLGKQLAIIQTKVGVIKFLRRYKSLVEPSINNRAFILALTVHLADSNVVLERFQ